MSSKKRKVNTKSSKTETALSDHRSGDSDLGFSNGLRRGNDADKSPGTSYSGGDNGSASSAFSPKLADSASASPLSVNSLSNQSGRVSNRIGEPEGGVPHKSGRSDLHQPYVDHFGSPTLQKYPPGSVPSLVSQHGADFFPTQFQPRVGNNFPPGFHHPSHLPVPNAYPPGPPFSNPYSQQQSPYHQPMNQPPLRPRPQAQPSLPSSYASSTPMLTQLLQYPTSKEKPLESGPGGDYINSVKHFFGKKPNQWPSGPPNMAGPNHLLNRMPGANHGFRQDPQMSQSLPFNNQFFQPLDSHQQQSVNHSTNRPPPFNNHPPHSKSPDVIISNSQDGELQHAKSSQHKKKSGVKKSIKSRSRMKRRPDITKQDYSSGDEKKDDDDDGGSDSSSGTEVYSQITPTSTPPLSPQPTHASGDHNNSEDLHDKSHATGFGSDLSRFQQGPNNGGGFPPPGSMMRQPNPYQNQPPFLPGQPIRHNPHMGGFYSPYQTSSMAPSKSTESDAYVVFKGGPSYHHQQGTISHHGGMANSSFNAFPRPGMNGPSMPYPGSSESSHQPPNAPPFYRHTNSFQAKSDQPPFGGNRPEFFPPNHPGFASGYPYDMSGYRPEHGYRHPGDVYRQEGPYPNFPGFRPDGPQFPGYRMPPQDGRMYRNPDQSAHRPHDGPMPNSNPGEIKLNEPNTRSEKILSPQQGNFVEGSNQKHQEENLDPIRSGLDNPANSLPTPGKNSIPTTSRMNNQWVTNMQGMMSGGSVVETPQNDHGQPVLSISSVKQVMGDSFEATSKDPSQHDAFSRSLPPHDLPDAAGKNMFQHPQHLSRPANEFYHAHYRESPDGRSSVSDSRSDADMKSRNSRPSSTSGTRIEFKHKSSERAALKNEYLRQDVYSPSMTPSNHMSMSPASQNDYDISHQKFSSNPAFMKIFEMGQEPDRVGFLERLFAFMNHRGTPITAVPTICKQAIDLYTLYFLVRERGGMIEVTKNKKWRDVSSALSLGSSSSAGFTLKRNYGKYIYPYECKFDRGDIDPAPFLATLEISGSKKEIGKKSSADRIQAASDVDNNSASNSYQDDKDSAYFGRGPTSPGSYGGEYGEDSLSQHPPPYSGRPLQSPEYPNRPFHNADRFDMISPHHEGVVDGPHGRCPPPPPSYRPYRQLGDQYPPHFDQRRMPDNPSDGYQHHGGFWSPPHPPPHPYPHPPNYPFYGAPPGHFGPYPPRFNVRTEMERTQRFPSMGYPPTVRMYSFPPGSVESVKAKNIKKRRFCHKDIGPVDPWRLLMSLKSGLLCEATWALDVLMILTRDDQTHSSVCLSNMPGMIEMLVEHFKSSLISIFPKSRERFKDLEISAEVQSIHNRQQKREHKDEEDDNNSSFHLKASEMSEINELATQKIKRKQGGIKYSSKSSCEEVLENYAMKEWDSHKNLESSSFDWQMGHCDTLMHVVASINDANEARSDKESETCKTKFFGHERLSLLNSIKKSDPVKTSESSDKIDFNIKAEIFASMNNVNMDEEMSSDPPAGKDENIEAGTGKVEDETISKHPDETSKFDEKSIKTDEGRGDLKEEDSEAKRSESTVYNRNDSLIKEMLEVKSFGMDASLSNTFSCSQIEALGASCLDDRAVVPFAANHDIEHERIKRKRQATLVAWDDEIFIPDDGPLCFAGELRKELTSRCLCISTILRNLSFVQSNDVEMSKHCGLILVLGKLLRLRHYHSLRELKHSKPSGTSSDAEENKREDLIPSLEKITDNVDCCSGDDSKNCQVPNLEMPDDLVMFKDEKKEADNSDCEETYESWWWYTVEVLRENALVVFANVSGQLDLSAFPEEICIPVLDGLLHWMVCQVGNQDDEDIAYSNQHFYMQHSSLSFRRLVLEALCKLCILDSNVDLLLAVPPFSRILLLFTRLVGLFEERQPLVVREMAVGLLSRLVPADATVARALALHRSFIPSIIDFLEASIDGRISTHDSPQHGQHYPYNPNFNANTSVDVLCRVASILRFMSEVTENETLIVRHQQRLLHLVTSPALNRTVASVLSSVLALCS